MQDVEGRLLVMNEQQLWVAIPAICEEVLNKRLDGGFWHRLRDIRQTLQGQGYTDAGTEIT